MGGVDLSDQKWGYYAFDRKTTKRWRHVFFKLLLTSVMNAWVIFEDVHHTKMQLFGFIVPLAEQMITVGKKDAIAKRKTGPGLPSAVSKSIVVVGGNLPTESETTWRCVGCDKRRKETRTKTVCTMRQVVLCKHCVTPYHT